MFTPSAVIGMWFRGILSIAVVAGAIALFAYWYRESPSAVQVVQSPPGRELEDTQPPRPLGTLERVSYWRPALDKPTTALVAATFLSMLSLGAGRFFYRLRRSPGKDEPSAMQSDKRALLRRPDGTELNIEEYGISDATTVILTHGWGTDSTEWYYAKKQLSKEYRVIVWDLPGVGLSSTAANNDYSIERFATDLRAVIEWSGASNIVLVGHSIGGMILQTFARLFPNEPAVAGLVLVHTTYTNPIRTTRNAAIYTAIEKPVIVPLLHLTIVLSPVVRLMHALSYLNGSTHSTTEKQSFSGDETRGQLDFVARYVLTQSPAVLAKGMLGMIQFDETSGVKTLSFPTLIVAAGEDPVTLPSASKYLTDAIPESRCVTIPRGRHQAQMEMHESFVGALKGFIRNSTVGTQTLMTDGDAAPRSGSANSQKQGLQNTSLKRRKKMATKADFTTQEWEALRDAPHLVAIAVAAAGISGPFGSIKEAFAPASEIIKAARGNNQLLRSICETEELKAAQQSLRSSIKITDAKTLREDLQIRAAEKAHEACIALQQKGAADDTDAYRTLLVNIADRTAGAAKEGGFFGFGGEWVSEGEREVIGRISKAFEVQPS
jgi:pimeloyl-ACP methyl ester carboxylesterase